MTEWRAKYEAHIRSARWRNMRLDMIRLRGDACEHCGHRYPLALHHKTYDRLGCELISDLELLCTTCHENADRKRERDSAARGMAACYNAAVMTFAEKKYGDADNVDWDRVEVEFDEWLERKNDDGG